MVPNRVVIILSTVLAFVAGYLISQMYPVFYPEKTEDSPVENSCDEIIDISVEISGAVSNPGVYDLNDGSRIIDAIKTAGDFTPDYDYYWVSKNINLSQILKDEQKIFIPFEALGYSVNQGSCSQEIFSSLQPSSTTESSGSSATAAGTTSQGTGKVNVNTVTFDELDALPGIGATYAGKIVANRPYSGVEEFKEKSGLTNSVYEKIKDLITY
ncbi:MAG: Exogenous DNA-binding protein [candidate division WWE3 bacterium GW2011_GWF2_41_45]|uniref:Exogenous DNA-binding protein n=1 Tax=candidate division WWE3 bacterium GW2011_GWC2_41_23 TaxID=1619123 RepID=A0A0G0VSY7_UNCKA|nr:MAG: Exogenous DNA-binding protein [candidate division WWE3 bacterium GW2011_GWC2_41_23]KKS10213.1 MAG: Exogenous DNA-binding protein [candidate division WWE3 bacterium GW2011_GWF2_41_45]KKS19555.1 MAG: Exogenous DNA-binding protein [candidate division WWE3 bacterium GW2011_GWE1_41_72]KKS28414.1 MAG: Exogenous DNA-binding protein [candidate division WWE3 bacterium GW2011_GWD2_42_11]KKS50501.1 MAG: Exogenous DNA-binding protein [candidate division WWE3 bacterium GW2011_GWE2_42_25]KKS61135.1 